MHRDSYGHRKLEIEEFLLDERAKPGGLPYVIVRLPDVLGPRDTTGRMWKLLIWMQSRILPITIPDFTRHLRTSYVYVGDVARVLCDIVQHGVVSNKLDDQTFNVGWPEAMTYRELIEAIAKSAGMDMPETVDTIAKSTGMDMPETVDAIAKSTSMDVTETVETIAKSAVTDLPETVDTIAKSAGMDVPEIVEGSNFIFPSVFRGPIDSTKAYEILDFHPVDFATAMRETVDFYRDAFEKFPRERDEAIESLLDDLEGSLPSDGREEARKRIYEAMRMATSFSASEATSEVEGEAKSTAQKVEL